LGVLLRDFLFAAAAFGGQLLLARVLFSLLLVRFRLVGRRLLVRGRLLLRGFLIRHGLVGRRLLVRVLLLLPWLWIGLRGSGCRGGGGPLRRHHGLLRPDGLRREARGRPGLRARVGLHGAVRRRRRLRGRLRRRLRRLGLRRRRIVAARLLG